MTGWKEQEIQRLPFYKVLLYLHAYNVLEGSNTEWLNADATALELTTVDELDKILTEL